MTEPRDTLASGALSAVARELASMVEEARAAAEGVRSWDAQSKSQLAGVTYELRRYQLGSDDCGVELQRAVTAAVISGAVAGDWKADLRPTVSSDPATIAAGLSAWDRRDGEDAAVRRIAEKLVELIKAYPDLSVLSISGSGRTVRVAGSAVLDNATREAVLVLGRMTAITSDRLD